MGAKRLFCVYLLSDATWCSKILNDMYLYNRFIYFHNFFVSSDFYALHILKLKIQQGGLPFWKKLVENYDEMTLLWAPGHADTVTVDKLVRRGAMLLHQSTAASTW